MPTQTDIYRDIAKRTGGDIYIGVTGPVRTGKSTFIKKFMDKLVIPNIDSEFLRERANDELPQSAAGKTIMTTEPKFIPENAVTVNLDNNSEFNVRMIDCVGYIVPSAVGYEEEDGPRMVRTPWFEEEIPFDKAAEIGTQKVIREHSTIGLVITTDGSISDIPREEYRQVEKRVIDELKEINKPFIVLLNSTNPESEQTKELASRMSEEYGVIVTPVNCLDLEEEDIKAIIAQVLFEFPIKEIDFSLPLWLTALPNDHWLKQSIFNSVKASSENVEKTRDIYAMSDRISEGENINFAKTGKIDLGVGRANVIIDIDKKLFYQILNDTTGLEVKDEQDLMSNIIELAEIKSKYMRVKSALDEVEATGYGIVLPETDELTLEEPEIIKQGGRFGVRLRASAPSIHMMKANIKTEVNPVVGSEKQSEDLVKYLLDEFTEDPKQIWESNIFGKSLHSLVNEGLTTKLSHMPSEARVRLQETIERVINDGCSGLICIIL